MYLIGHTISFLCLQELITVKDGVRDVFMVLEEGDVIGEVGVLCYIPQPFAVRTRRLTQLLLLDRTKFLSIVQANPIDGQKVMENFTQVHSVS
jgi:CRP-like cAMP-binding protein